MGFCLEKAKALQGGIEGVKFVINLDYSIQYSIFFGGSGENISEFSGRLSESGEDSW